MLNLVRSFNLAEMTFVSNTTDGKIVFSSGSASIYLDLVPFFQGPPGTISTDKVFGTLTTTNLGTDTIQVYWDEDAGETVITRSGDTYAPTSLIPTYTGDHITIWQAGGQAKVIDDLPYTYFRDQSNNGFANVAACMLHLQSAINPVRTDFEAIVLQGLV